MKKQVPVRVLETADDFAAGVQRLRKLCPVMRRVHDLSGTPALRRFPSGFPGLARIIVGQQLSTASAGAIWGRLAAAVDPFEPHHFLAQDDAELAACGLSRAKIRTLRGLASAVAVEGLDLVALEKATDAAIHEALTGVTGIGPWTADIYLMFCLGRADAWAPGDLALQIATQRALRLRNRPDKARLAEISERWRPWRAVAAQLLWSFYALPASIPRPRRDAG